MVVHRNELVRPSSDPIYERLRLGLEAVHVAHGSWDLVTGEDFYSPKWWQMLGYAADELPAEATLWVKVCHPDDTAKFDAAFSDALNAQADSFAMDYRLRHKQGHYVAVHSQAKFQRDPLGKPVSLLGANRALTQREGHQDPLAESENRYRDLVDWSPGGLAVVQDGRIVLANPAAVKILGAARREDLVGTPLESHAAPHCRAVVRDRFAAVTASASPDIQRQLKFVRVDGRTIEVESHAIPSRFHGEFAIQYQLSGHHHAGANGN